MVGFMNARTLILSAALAAASPAFADAVAGQKVFKSDCAVCHAVTSGTNKVGPSLYGVVGRPAASAAGYKYSAAMTNSGLTWSAAELPTYLAAPGKTVPGTKMTYGGVKDATKRADVVAYLGTLTDNK
jgi:cytochrome c